jgi:hypothetical protein
MTCRIIAKAGVTDWFYATLNSFDEGDAGRAYFDLTNGLVGFVDPSVVATAIEDLGGGWFACYYEKTTTTDLSGFIQVYPRGGNLVGPDIGDTIVIGNMEFFDGKTIAQVKGSAPIVTAGATGTSTTVNISYPVANHSSAQGFYYMEATNLSTTTLGAGGVGWMTMGSSARIMYNNSNISSFRAYDGATLGPNMTRNGNYGDVNKQATVYDLVAAEYNSNSNGTYGIDATYGGFTPNIDINLVGQTTAAGPTITCLIRNIQRWDLPYADAKAKIDELMI